MLSIKSLTRWSRYRDTRTWLGLASLLLLVFTSLSIRPVQAISVTSFPCQPSQPSHVAAVCQDSTAGGDPLFGAHGLFGIAAEILTLIIGIGSVVVLVLAGIRFTTSSGDANKVAAARSTVIYALIGLAVAAFAQAISYLLLVELLRVNIKGIL